ncbi:16S rRNA (guanine(527)-N(7))-methyltransferase RsmG [Lactococcus insecticola]|uniref:Ribosomal RNA small subunit methyltransferase G n=1 Tax=Pseudolactococcus insecticola TaxID=2709158 RepID=A0A6A0B5X1_9LACT|nr:16S rRNA (guanine(527)-N(7))-methyltransferase RsmG [Lactococcus insecticola]GFH40083.1 ribosomal RNA small subunit methyltransferase G [Lactococcus insecticola]
MTPEDFYSTLETFNITLSEYQKQQFETYFNFLVTENEKINLTAITEKNDVYLKHFYDSVAPILYDLVPNQPIRLLDIGAGAGFPSFPMKIIFPELNITIIDSLNKRIKFLAALSEKLGFSSDSINLLHGRAEDLGQNPSYRGQFDLVTARAVARLNVLSELTLPFLKKDGSLISLKASQMLDEIAESKQAIAVLGGKLTETRDYTLPNGDERHLVVIEKKKETPKKYPRQAGTPNKKPL